MVSVIGVLAGVHGDGLGPKHDTTLYLTVTHWHDDIEVATALRAAEFTVSDYLVTCAPGSDGDSPIGGNVPAQKRWAKLHVQMAAGVIISSYAVSMIR